MLNRKKIAMTIAGALLLASSLMAQETKKDSSDSNAPTKTKMMNVGFGYAYADMSALNTFFSATTPGSFSPHFGVISFNGTTVRKRFVYGSSLQGGMTMKTTIDNYDGIGGNQLKYSASFAQLVVKAGYAIVSTERVKLYPLLGIGAGVTSADYETMNTNQLKFGYNPFNNGAIRKYSGVLDASLNFDFQTPSRWSESGNFGKTIGLKVGYTQAFDIGNWFMEHQAIGVNPVQNPGFFYGQITFGMFHKRKMTTCCGSSCQN